MKDHSLRTEPDVSETIRAFADTVYKVALNQMKSREEAEDVFQDVFCRYAFCKTEFKDHEHKKAWLIRVTLNCCRNRFASAWFRHTTGLSDDQPAGSMQESREVFDAVMRLPKKYRTVVHLFYYEDMSIREIGQALGIKENTIASQLDRARELLRKSL